MGTGISFTGVLFLIFLTLKLAGIIAWSWWWVTAPLWLPSALVLATVVFGGLIALVVGVVLLVIKLIGKS